MSVRLTTFQDNYPRRIVLSQPGGNGVRRRPMLQRKDGVVKDTRKFNAASWQQLSLNRAD